MQSGNILKKVSILLILVIFLVLNFHPFLKLNSITDIVLPTEVKADSNPKGFKNVDCKDVNGDVVAVCTGRGILACECKRAE